MSITELEEKMCEHARVVKEHIDVNFNIEAEEKFMKKNQKFGRIAVLVAAAVCLIGTSAFAAYRYLSAGDVADRLGDSELAKYFDEDAFSETVTDGDYSATVLGIATGEGLSKFESSAWELFPERTYAVVAVERSDGGDMSFDDEILVSPLIEGYAPWNLNIMTMHGGYSANIIDGVLYRIIELDSVECFADRNVYMAVVSETFLNNKPFAFDEETGEISPKEDYDGTNILIKLNLDPDKADSKKAEEYLERLFSGDEESADEEIAAPEGGEETKLVITESGENYVMTKQDSDGEMEHYIIEEK